MRKTFFQGRVNSGTRRHSKLGEKGREWDREKRKKMKEQEARETDKHRDGMRQTGYRKHPRKNKLCSKQNWSGAAFRGL